MTDKEEEISYKLLQINKDVKNVFNKTIGIKITGYDFS